MHRITNNCIQIRGIHVAAIAIVTIITVTATTSSCFNTNTNTCEPSGRRCPDGKICDLAQDACIDPGGCGDGFTDRSKGEVCDDGNIRDGDGCSHDCKSKEICGNGIHDVKEECDDGNLIDGDGCNSKCHIEACGNKTIDPGEVCDDGNTDSDDGCSANCMSNEVCGNGIIDNNGPSALVHEDCDPINSFPALPQDTEECNNDCTFAVCGDGHVNTNHHVPDIRPELAGSTHPEECDPGTPEQDSPGCNRDCSFAKCGDGYKNGAAGEQCDDGFSNSDLANSNCRKDCLKPACGDGITDDAPPYLETCDDGNHDNNDICPDGPGGTCQQARCGDGFIRNKGPGPHEQCDPGDPDEMNHHSPAGCLAGFHCRSDCSQCDPNS